MHRAVKITTPPLCLLTLCLRADMECRCVLGTRRGEHKLRVDEVYV